MLLDLLNDDDKDMRAIALDQVRTEAQGNEATKRFAGVLRDMETDRQVGLLGALSERGDVAARTAVLDLLAATKDQSVRAAAIKALGSLGDPSDCRRLVRSLGYGTEAERTAARDSLVRLRGVSVPQAIVAEMQGASLPLRVSLIETLAERRALGTIPDLLGTAAQGHPHARTAAMVALGQLASPEHIPGLIQGVLRARGADRATAERALVSVCDRVTEGVDRAAPLLAAMSRLAPGDRIAMLPTLGRVGGPQALRVVEDAIDDPSSWPHAVGLRSLCNWPDASVAPQLIELAKTDRHPSHRHMALRALIRIAPLPDGRSDQEKLELLQTAMTMCTRDADRNYVLQRARAIRIVETLRFVVRYLDQPPHAKDACQTVVELAHHRNLRQPNKAEFDQALDKVIQTSQDATVVDRANRYKNNQTWVRQ